MSRLEILEGEAWRELVAAPIAVIVLAKRGCPVCQAWVDELTAFLDADQRWQDVRFGELFLYDSDHKTDDDDEDDDDGIGGGLARILAAEVSSSAGPQGSFARTNQDWLSEVQDLPCNVLYVQGQRVKTWPGAGTARLVSRLEAVAPR